LLKQQVDFLLFFDYPQQSIQQGWGTFLLPRAALIVEYRWRAANIKNFILKFYLYLQKENKKLCQGARETPFDIPVYISACLGVSL